MAEQKTIKIKIPKINIWNALTVILAVLFLISLTQGWSITNKTAGNQLSSTQAANKAIDYLNKNLVQPGTTATLASVKETGPVYEVTTSYQNQQIPVYVTKDGVYLFLSAPLNMDNKTSSTSGQQTSAQAFDAPDTQTPSVELFVMSFCPYGTQAETLMRPVVDLLGTKADIKIRFIATVQGNTSDSVQSLHGAAEAMEDLRQVCIMKNYDQKTYWNYLSTFDKNCPNLRTNTTALDQCWKNAATAAGIDVAKIDTCSKNSEGLNLLKADEQAASQYGVTGSPTLVINGKTYSGQRSSDAFKSAICTGFTTSPSECSQSLSTASGSVTGGCQ